ncbi:uncharacterized protein LOC110981803 isoform X2 [Acanthaster planci]|uniref:Uncharacterized protein LOC110981803 isoform X2 n=1 Tax=Acanthaster planci TaxID=133434 RepID=A0A8B7YSI1_ACAPL|nr:uncharacterized protein LOC110981803 isoform X2 [Acanthaster planci]
MQSTLEETQLTKGHLVLRNPPAPSSLRPPRPCRLHQCSRLTGLRELIHLMRTRLWLDIVTSKRGCWDWRFLAVPKPQVPNEDGGSVNCCTSPSYEGDQQPKLEGSVCSETFASRRVDTFSDSKVPKGMSQMWEYGMPLPTSPHTRPKNNTQNVSSNNCNRPHLHSPDPSDGKFKLNAASSSETHPFKTQQSLPQATCSSSPSNKISDSTPRRADRKSVSFLISPTAQETHDLPHGAKPPMTPSPVPKSALKQSLNQVSRPSHQPPHVCAMVMNSPPEPKGSPTHPTGRHPHAKERVRVQFSDDENDQDSNQDLNAKYADESQAYTAYTSRGHFTPHPDSGHMDHPPAVRSSYRDQLSRHPAESIEDTEDAQPLAREDSRVDLNQFLDDFLSLVDRYWNGTKSLHRHGKFQSQAHSMLATLVNRILGSVPQQRPDIPKDSSADTNKLRQALRAAQDQMANLKDELEAALADKRKLQANLDAVQHETPSSDRPGDRPADSSRQTDRIARSGLLEKEVEKLHLENESLKLHVRHFNQLQELATMLQESHKSLVTTNDHLLQELDEAKQRHLEEVKQLHWSYSELKRTLELAPGMPQGGPRTTNQHHANGVLS